MKPENYPTQPAALWDQFFNITRIPRPSKSEEHFREYILNLAKEHNYETRTDEVGNVVVYVPGTEGFENNEPVIIQNHMDMVTDATPDREIDFHKDPIEVYVENGWLTADRTTLGADNGIGCAAALALIVDKTVAHPPLELLFTTDEETGLNGAWGVQSDFFKSKKLINLDTEEWGSLYIGCAGGADYHFNHQFETSTPSLNTFKKITISRLVGGHSGVDIHLQHANAIKLCNEILKTSGLDFEIANIDAGRAHNIIPRDAAYTICINSADEDKWNDHIDETVSKWKSYLVKKDQRLKVNFENTDEAKSVLTLSDSKKFAHFVTLFPHGAHAYLESDRDLVAISNNLAIVKLEEGKLFINTSLRFFDRKEIIQIENELQSLSEVFGYSLEKISEYPSWKPAPESNLLDLFKDRYKEEFGNEAIVTAIHAGLECGILRDRIGELDAVSFGPTIMGAHSPAERLKIDTVEPFWNLFKSVLAKL